MSADLGPVIGIVVLAVFALIALGVGIFLLVRYAQTRRTPFLIGGLVLTLVLPGLLCCLALMLFAPFTTVAYGPPPSVGP
jgi:hypothetical protein